MKQRTFRYCERCETRFIPTGKIDKLCEECWTKARKNTRNKNKKDNLLLAYNKLKEELDEQRHSETLRKFEILNKAYDLGNKIYGHRSFSIMKLGLDFEMPFSTCKRILALRKANKRTWKLIKDKKISSFKVSMILLKKDTVFQDEIIDLVIKDNLSTFQIRSLNVRNLEDINKERLRIAVERGFARNDRAYYSFYTTLERLGQLLLLKEENLPKKKIPLLKKRLKEINKEIEKYVKEI